MAVKTGKSTDHKTDGFLYSLLDCCAPGMIRTCDTRFRKPVLYPLSYEGEFLILT